MPPIKLSFILLCAIAAIGITACSPRETPADWQKFMAWFSGTYDNHEQVWRQQEEGKEVTIKHRQQVVRKVSAPAIGSHVYLAEQHFLEQEKPCCPMLYALQREPAGSMRAVAYLPRDEAAAASLLEADEDIPMQGLRPAEDCDVLWHPEGDAFIGALAGAKGCQLPPGWAGGPACMSQSFRLDDDSLHSWTRPCDGVEESFHAGRRQRYYQGWMGIQRKRLGLEEDGDGWVFMRGFRIHNEGQIVPLLFEDGTPTGYSIQLARLTYLSSGLKLLKLGLLDETGYTFSYTWSDVDSALIGINLRWFQAGLRAEGGQAH